MIGFQNSLESTSFHTEETNCIFCILIAGTTRVQLRNENKPDDMGKILEELHIKYVPTN